MQLPPLSPVPTVSVVMPAVDAAATLPHAVDSALAQTGSGFELTEVVIAVGPSRDDTRDLAASLAADDTRVRVVDNPTGRTPAALNAAVGAATGEVVARVDTHAVLPPGYLARAVADLRATGAANVGGKQVPTADAGFARAAAAAMASPVGAGGAAYRVSDAAGPVETVYLGVFRRAALDAVGGFDERLVRNQDYELNHRLRAAGGVVWFDPDLAVAYRPRGTIIGLARQYLDYGRWKRAVLRLHPRSLKPRQLAPPALVLALAAGLTLGLLTAAWWPLAVLTGLWIAVLVVGALAAAPRRALPTAVALAVMHVCWGVGFFLGAGAARGLAPPRRPAAPDTSRPDDDPGRHTS